MTHARIGILAITLAATALASAAGCSSADSGGSGGSAANAGGSAANAGGGAQAAGGGAQAGGNGQGGSNASGGSGHGGQAQAIHSDCAPAKVQFGVPRNTKTTSMDFRGMAAADFNRDGKDDIVVLEGGGVEVFISNGDGTFMTGKTYVANLTENGDITVGDFTGDGFTDVMMPTSNLSSGVMALFAGKGDGTLGSVPTFIPTGTASVTALRSADVNGDGNLDFAYDCNDLSCNAGVVLNAGKAMFGATTPFPQAVANSNWTFGDVNGDGAADLAIVHNRADEGTCVLLSTGSGSFGEPKCYTAAMPGSQAPDMSGLGDIDGDGDLDLIGFAANFGGGGSDENNIAAYLNDGKGAFGERALSSLVKAIEHITMADMNNDGKADLIVLTFTGVNSVVDVMLSNGDGTFAAPAEYAAGSLGAYGNRTVIGDFAGNGLRGFALPNKNEGFDVVVATCKP